ASSGTMVVGYLDGSVYKKTPFFIENTVADFGAGKYDVSYYYPLMEKPENWSSGYAAYYVFENGNYALNSSSEWKENATYYKKITAEKKFYRKEYVLLESEPADWADAFSTYYVCSGRNYLQNNNAAFAPDTFYRLTFTRLKDEPDDWTTAYGSYYTTAASYLSVTDEFCLADLEKLGLPIGGGCKVTAGFEQTDYVLRYELNLNVGDNRVSDDPQVKSALNDMGFFDADDGLFVYNQLLHYNDTIPWVSLPAITHYNFNGWQMLNGEARPTTMPRPKDGEVLTVVGTFSAEKYLITVMSGANGQARIGSTTGVESGYYSYGDTIRIFVTANAGYQLKDWTYGEGRVLFDAGDPQSASGSILRYDSEDDTEETIIYYFFYKITGDASDDDKSIKCSFTEREYKIVYRINYIYDDEDVTGEEFYTQEFTSAWKDGLTYIKETTNVQYYRVYYALGGQVTQDDLNAAMKYIGVDYVYNGTLSGGNVDLNNAATVTIGGREYYKLPIKKTNGVETKNILCYTYYGVSKMDYVSEQAISYREDLLGRQGFAITATDSAFYNSTASIATAPTAKELNMPYSAGVVYWRFSNWTANYSEANQTPSAFTMPMRTVIVTGTYTISEYDLTIAMGGEGSNTLRYVSVNGRDPSYYEGDDVCLRIPYNSVVEVEYQLKTGYDFTEITCIQNGQGQTIASDPQEKTKYVYYVKFNFASGEDMTYTLGSESVDYILTSYLRVDRENAESTEYLLSRSGLNVDMSRTKRIDSNVYYFFRIDRQMLYQDTLSDHTEVPSASLLETCNYVFGHWNYVYEEDGDYVAYTDARMPDKDLIAYTTLTIKTFGVEVVTDTQYDFDPIGTDTGVYLTATPVSKATVNNLPAYDYYTAFNLSYILPLGYHFDNWTITNTGTGSATALQSGAYFRRTYEPLSARPTDWTTKYGSYYIKLEGADGKYV
ncbi:MAG: hypothetical protein J5781_04885, partial [Clostridia bacterium]|nr:hypothetical protein [Clostridia bacterium]